MFNGEGVYIYSNGERYEGKIVNGKKHGFGTYYYANGNIYEGEWSNDLKHGKGKYEYNLQGESY